MIRCIHGWLSVWFLHAFMDIYWGGLCTPLVCGYVYSFIKLLLKKSCVLKVQGSMWMHSHCELSCRIGIPWWEMVFWTQEFLLWWWVVYRILGCTESLRSGFCLAMVRSVITGWRRLSVYLIQPVSHKQCIMENRGEDRWCSSLRENPKKISFYITVHLHS